ncbi:hypothetical protein [Paenibacillus harenae]|uniref:hypothetical protein n=1 Tax=Paenibacillus harenae TaxID=306543 RepID=UPI0027945391|nr:hypothetical protein [Paenibacillus harenae]MDQ0059918.1 hypothetical protein [Paenibacillus harenae]
MVEVNELIHKCIRMWNEPDPVVRRELITDLWEADGLHYAGNIEARGLEQIEQRVANAYDKFVKQGGYQFILSDTVRSLRDVVMYNWEMVPSGGGEASASGFVFLFINKNGRVRLEYQL